MMKPEEAIEGLNPIVDNEAFTDRFQDVCRTAVSALEKQIPKKPEKKEKNIFVELDNGRHESGKKDVFCCPICGESVGRKYGEHPIVNVQNYCKKCGQRIDWTAEE